jgi:hypothetical protein
VRTLVGVIPLVVAVCLAGCGGGTAVSHPESAASCVGPKLTLSTPAARAGASVWANGEYFAADCYDTGQRGRPPALTGLHLSVVQNGKTWRVASDVRAAHHLYRFHVPIGLPSDLHPGTAIVRVDGYGPPATLHVMRDKQPSRD